MKRILNFVIAIVICGNTFSQISPNYRFRKPTSVNSSTWKFTNVTAGVDAIVSVVSSKNATVDKIDDSSIYAYAWNPAIKYTNKMNSNSDSSYVEFAINFVNSSNNSIANTQSNLAMTVIDCDGTLTYREMVKTAQPATSKGILGSVLSLVTDTKWLTAVGSVTDFGGIDTSVYIAMTQINYSNITSYKMKIGVLGKVPANTVRQASFYFKGFSAMSVPLDVKLTSFDAELNGGNTELTWVTASEDNLSRFEVCRSVNGTDFFPIGTVSATGISNEATDYNFTDNTVSTAGAPVVYYRLKMIDEDGKFKWSNITVVKTNGSVKATTVTVYPNPTADFVNVTLDNETEAAQISIIDAFGKTVQTEMNQMNNNVQFDVRNLENGIYFIQISNNDGSTTSSKFIKR